MLEGDYFFHSMLLLSLSFLVDAACGMTLPAALGLLLARRGHADLCGKLTGHALRLNLVLAVSGLFYYPFSCYLVLAPYHNPEISFWSSLFSTPGLPWFSAWLAWLAGLTLLFLAAFFICHVKPDPQMDSLPMREIRVPFYFALAGSACFFASFFLINWPFAGFPPELSTQRVLLAVARNAFRHWFISLSYGGAFALVFMLAWLVRTSADKAEAENAIRWCAFWAAAGAFPTCFLNWGLLAGILIRGNSLLPSQPGAYGQIFAIIFLTLAIACFLYCLWRKRSGPVAWLGLLFLACRALAPLSRFVL